MEWGGFKEQLFLPSLSRTASSSADQQVEAEPPGSTKHYVWSDSISKLVP